MRHVKKSKTLPYYKGVADGRSTYKSTKFYYQITGSQEPYDHPWFSSRLSGVSCLEIYYGLDKPPIITSKVYKVLGRNHRLYQCCADYVAFRVNNKSLSAFKPDIRYYPDTPRRPVRKILTKLKRWFRLLVS